MSNSSFKWISYEVQSESPYITIDSQRRLYLSSGGRALLGFPKATPFSLFVGYDHANKRLVVAKPDIVKAANVRPAKFDKRSYANAKPYIRALNISRDQLPIRFEYIGKDFSEYSAGSYVFRMTGFTGEDDTE